MLARFLRHQSRPVRYAIHTQDMLPSLQFGLKSLARNHGILWPFDSMHEGLRGYGAVPGGFQGHWDSHLQQYGRRDTQFMHDALSDLIATGHPDALAALMHHAHNEMGVPLPGRWSHLHGGMGGLIAHLHHMNNQAGAAMANPRHPLRQYTPDVLMDQGRAESVLAAATRGDHWNLAAHPEVQQVMPAAGGRGLGGLHDAYDLTRMTTGASSPHTLLGRLIHGLHWHLTQQSGLNEQQLGTASLGG
jgi:hypothetical protein